MPKIDIEDVKKAIIWNTALAQNEEIPDILEEEEDESGDKVLLTISIE